MQAVNVFAQQTPNPRAYKFACSVAVAEAGLYEVKAEDAPTGLPLIDAFFVRWPVERVFLAANFITAIKRRGSDEWFELAREMREHVADHLRQGLHNPASLPDHLRLPATHEAPTEVMEWFDGPLWAATSQDGGAIVLQHLHEGELTLRLVGACYDCPHAPQTVEEGIVKPVRQRLGQPLTRVDVLG